MSRTTARLLTTTILGISALSGMGYSSAAFGQATGAAQAQSAPVLEEITVTARKRPETVQDAPLAITAFSANDIAAAQLHNIGDIAALAPGMTFHTFATINGNGRAISILSFRGVISDGTEKGQSGSAFIDGVYLFAGMASIDTSNIERVEVLKGPQNTFFGRNTFAGAVNFITKQPTDKFQGEVEAEATNRGSSNLHLGVQGALVPGILDGRLSVVDTVKGSEYTATDGGQLGGQSSKGADLTLVATPIDNLKVTLHGHFSQDNDQEGDNTYIRGIQYGSLCPGQTFPGVNAKDQSTPYALSRPYFCGTIPSLGALESQGFRVTNSTTLFPAWLVTAGNPNGAYNVVTNNNTQATNPLHDLFASAPSLNHLGLARDFSLLSEQGQYTFENAGFLTDWTVFVNTSYQKTATNYAFSSAANDSQNNYSLNADIADSENAELRVQSPQDGWLKGLFGFNYGQVHQRMGTLSISITTVAGVPTTGQITPPALRLDQHNRIPAGFMAGDIVLNKINPNLPDITLSGELRWQMDQTDTLGTAPVTFHNLLPRAIISYKPWENTNIYASYSQGVQEGQLNGAYITASPIQQAQLAAAVPGIAPFAPLPRIDNYEIGVKQRLFGGRFEYEAAAYRINWTNINFAAGVNVTGPTGTGATSLSVIVPANAHIQGVEWQGKAIITDHLDADATFDWRQTHYTQIFSPLLATLTSGTSYFGNNALPRDPNYTASFAATYHDHLFGNWDYSVRFDGEYTGAQWESEANIGQFAGYWRFNSVIGFTQDNLTLELFAKNLLDDKNWDSGLRSTSTGEPLSALLVPYNGANTTVQGLLVQPPDKREFGIRARLKFDAGEEAPATTASYTPPPVQAVAPAKAPRSYLVFFDFNKSDLTSQAVSIVDTAAKNAGPAKVTQIEVTGHTDTVGSDAYNMRLSRRRAEAVAKQLEKDGIPSSEIAIFAKGKKDLLVPTADGVREPQNRRVQIMYEGGANS